MQRNQERTVADLQKCFELFDGRNELGILFQETASEREKWTIGQMSNTALVVIDIQNDITKNYKDIIDGINAAVDWAVGRGMQIAYILHNNITAGTRTFKPGSKGAELVPELKVVTDNIFVKTKANALTSDAFASWIESNGIDEFFITGADATACVKSTCFNMAKAGYTVHVISDCITSYDPKKLGDMLDYYSDKGCEVKTLDEYGCFYHDFSPRSFIL